MDSVYELKSMAMFIDTCHQSWLKGWNERNGGNMSYRMKPEGAEAIRPFLRFDGPARPIGVSVPSLAGEFFIVTGSGKFYKNILREPENNICVLRVDDAGETYQIVWGLAEGGVPTSELPTHLLNHAVKKETTNGAYRVIMHAHPANTVALTFLLPLEDKAFTRNIWEMITECPIVFPAGIGVLPWMVCGTNEIGEATAEKMKQYRLVVWGMHGLYGAGKDIDEAFGLVETVEKAAQIYMLIGDRPRLNTIHDDELVELGKAFGLDYRKDFLNL